MREIKLRSRLSKNVHISGDFYPDINLDSLGD